ncbi:hypothetical protein ACOSQ3_031332 [Xanthoceras sorbifolium]
MLSMILSVKFLGSQVEFLTENWESYTLASLLADVYMCTCSTLPDPSETFRVEAKLPWIGEYLLINDNKGLQDVFKMFKEKRVDTIRIDVELLPSMTLSPEKDFFHTNLMDESS